MPITDNLLPFLNLGQMALENIFYDQITTQEPTEESNSRPQNWQTAVPPLRWVLIPLKHIIFDNTGIFY